MDILIKKIKKDNRLVYNCEIQKIDDYTLDRGSNFDSIEKVADYVLEQTKLFRNTAPAFSIYNVGISDFELYIIDKKLHETSEILRF